MGGIDNLEFDFSQVPLLDQLIYTYTNIQVLDLSQNPALVEIDIRGNLQLTDLNIKNGTNNMIDITSMFPSNFTNLDALENVCLDDVNSNLATHILNHVAHPVNFTEDCTLAIIENRNRDFVIYPNPSSDFITVEHFQPFKEIQIYDIQGTLIKSYPAKTASQALNIAELRTGIYFVQIIGRGTATTKKLIKK